MKSRLPEGVLVMRISALGDVAMTIPVIYDACLSNPSINFYFLTGNFPSQLFVRVPGNLTVIPVDFNNYKGIPGLWKLFKSLSEKYDFDTVVDLQDVWTTRIIRLFARFSGRYVSYISNGDKEKKALTRPSGKVLLQLKPVIHRYEDALWRGFVYCRHDFRSVFPDGKGPVEAFERVTKPKELNQRWLAVAPFAGQIGKTYPPELMKQVIDHFANRQDIKIFLFGDEGIEAPLLDKLKAGRANVINMSRFKIGLDSELALLSHCDLMISMDAANMHMAALVDLPVVSIWGATHPFAGYLGYERKISDAIQLEMTCRPCSVFGNKPCLHGDYHCLYGIKPSMVIAKASPYLTPL